MCDLLESLFEFINEHKLFSINFFFSVLFELISFLASAWIFGVNYLSTVVAILENSLSQTDNTVPLVSPHDLISL
ncbi:hypothetical protein [Saccharolobus islandicus]|nr:hypothetical protein [Sulfolobus islandicus]